MKTRLQKVLHPIFLTLVLFACKKSETLPAPEDVVAIKFVKQVTASANDFVSYEYNAAGNVTRYISQWQNGSGGTNRLNNVFEYNGNKLAKFSNEAGSATFTYNGNQINKSEHFVNNGKKLSTYTYEYDASGRVSSINEVIANPLSDGISETRLNYQYYSNGNLSKIDFSHKKAANDPFVLSYSKLFVEYDNKKNPEPDDVAGFFLPGQILQKNNPVKINNVLPNGTIEGYSRFEYTYNADGYPLTRKHYIAIGSTEDSARVSQYTY